MICPHCSIGVSLEFEDDYTDKDKDFEQTGMGHQIAWDYCPECDDLIVILRRGKLSMKKNDSYANDTLQTITEEEIIFPKYVSRKVEREVPDAYKADFLEACSVLLLSPKASAALSRRILQKILREEYHIKPSSLAKEIDAFIELKDIPAYLLKAVDAVRNIGNFAAHPLKDTNTGEIVDVELGEAEWLLEVLESLFDFTFIQPRKLEERKKKLNEKLKAIGKSAMKEC